MTDVTIINNGSLETIVTDAGAENVTLVESGTLVVSGDSSGVPVMQVQADIAIGGHRAVVLNSIGKAIYADNTIAAHANGIIGISIESASAGGFFRAQFAGLMQEPSWSWTPNLPVFLSTNGLLTQAPPVSPAVFSHVLGVAVSGTSIAINLKDPIFV